MGLFDSLRGRNTDRGDDQQLEPANAPGAAPESIAFSPRSDGSYRADGSSLQFGGSRVYETDGQGVVRAGEYTSAGRFLVTAPLESAVTVSVIRSEAEGFLARRTATADRSSVEVHYRFVPTGS